MSEMTREEARMVAQSLIGELEQQLADLRLLLTPPTCATCQWWEELRNANGIGLGDGRCFQGVRVGRPTRQNVDGGIYTAKDFGCTKHESRPKAAEEER